MPTRKPKRPSRPAAVRKPRPAKRPSKSAAARSVGPPKTVPAVPEQGSTERARSTLLEAVYREAGVQGSRLEHPNGVSFDIHSEHHECVIHSPERIVVPLTEGRTTSHVADLVAQVEHRLALYVDITTSRTDLGHIKALGYDAIHLRQAAQQPFRILVVVRTQTKRLEQAQIEAVAHAYDYVFGIDESVLGEPDKFAACRSEILSRLKARRPGGA